MKFIGPWGINQYKWIVFLILWIDILTIFGKIDL